MKQTGWNNIKDKWPEPNTEVVVFYLVTVNGSNFYASEVIHEKIIDKIDSSIMYWIKKPQED